MIRKFLVGIAIAASIPTVSAGGSLVISLIQGKTPAEAIQILAEQMDALIGRVEMIETKQTEQKQSIEELQTELFTIKNKEVCDKLDSFESQIQSLRNPIPETGIKKTITEIKESQAAYINQCQSYWATVPQECRDLPYGRLVDGIDRPFCARQYNSQIPKECIAYPEEIKNYESALASYQKQIESALASYQKQLLEILSDPEYLRVKEECKK